MGISSNAFNLLQNILDTSEGRKVWLLHTRSFAEAQLMLKIVTQPRKLHLYEAYPLNRTLFLPPVHS